MRFIAATLRFTHLCWVFKSSIKYFQKLTFLLQYIYLFIYYLFIIYLFIIYLLFIYQESKINFDFLLLTLAYKR